jgi:hypothetical protein
VNDKNDKSDAREEEREMNQMLKIHVSSTLTVKRKRIHLVKEEGTLVTGRAPLPHGKPNEKRRTGYSIPLDRNSANGSKGNKH